MPYLTLTIPSLTWPGDFNDDDDDDDDISESGRRLQRDSGAGVSQDYLQLMFRNQAPLSMLGCDGLCDCLSPGLSYLSHDNES